MANVLLSWTSPADITNVESIELFRINDAASALQSAPVCADYVDATGALVTDVDHLTAGLTGSNILVPSAISTAMTYVDTVSATGNYYYAAFSKNAAGYSPCTNTNAALAITV
jgi:hypothetical protein